ncbi:MAG: FAD-dependent oxidoreductase [Candidatus Levybacteria bacterium]|nr:FAD-dependent oxidoreductase [Candidatus Levybacteria bacterium]
MKNDPKHFIAEFSHKEKLAKNTYSFYFFKKKLDLNFIPGQYLRMSLNINKPDVRGSSRYFTISSSPRNLEYLVFTTKIIKSSFKKRMFSLKKGEQVDFFGPVGYFDFNEKSNNQKIFLAGGIGITPFHSILQTIKDNKKIPNIILFSSFSTKEEVIFYDELKVIEKENSNIRVVYMLTRKSLNGFEKGGISEKLIRKYAPDYLKSEFFIVGSPSFEEQIFTLVKEMGIPEERIFKENFSGY